MSLGTLDLLLIRHAEAVPAGAPGWGARDDERPLTDAGSRAAQELADELEPFHIDAAYSSPFARAVATIEPIARRRGLPIRVLPDLRERMLTDGQRPDWLDHLTRSWTDPDYALPGTETGRAAQRRAMGVLDLLRIRHSDGGRILVGSHGNLISLVLQALEPAVNLQFHLDMPNPAIYHLEHDGKGWRVMGGHGFVQAAPRN